MASPIWTAPVRTFGGTWKMPRRISLFLMNWRTSDVVNRWAHLLVGRKCDPRNHTNKVKKKSLFVPLRVMRVDRYWFFIDVLNQSIRKASIFFTSDSQPWVNESGNSIASAREC
jgi:hypothetical protein